MPYRLFPTQRGLGDNEPWGREVEEYTEGEKRETSNTRKNVASAQRGVLRSMDMFVSQLRLRQAALTAAPPMHSFKFTDATDFPASVALNATTFTSVYARSITLPYPCSRVYLNINNGLLLCRNSATAGVNVDSQFVVNGSTLDKVGRQPRMYLYGSAGGIQPTTVRGQSAYYAPSSGTVTTLTITFQLRAFAGATSAYFYQGLYFYEDPFLAGSLVLVP